MKATRQLNTRQRALQAGYWLIPPLLCLHIHWYGLKAWFQADDFVWIGLLRNIHGAGDLWEAIFQPTIDGALRPWSDRVFFLVFQALFGLNAFPYHLWVFLTEFANIALMMSIVRRLTGSCIAGFCAPIIWTANSVMLPMTWATLYKDILCSFFLLLAFHFFLLYIETGKRRYYLWQWIVFILGFGAMETNLMYPAIAASYSLCCARSYFRKTLPLFMGSIVFLAVNFMFVKKPVAGPYSIYFDWSIVGRFFRYWRALLEPENLRVFTSFPPWWMPAVEAAVTALLVSFVLWQAWRKNWLPVFFVSWFAFTLAPVLPLREQFMTYYLTVPSAGVAMLAAYALSKAVERPTRWAAFRAVAAVILALMFLIPSAIVARKAARWWYERSRRVQAMVLGVVKVHEQNPDKTILLEGVDDQLFVGGIRDKAFRAVGVPEVYLAAGSESKIQVLQSGVRLDEYILPAEVARSTLDRNQLLVFAIDGKSLKDLTWSYLKDGGHSASVAIPRRIDLGSPTSQPFLDAGWYPIEDGYRWMSKRAAVHLGGPQHPDQKLHVGGNCPAELLASGPLALKISINAQMMPLARVREGSFDLTFPLTPELVGKDDVLITIEVSRTFHPLNDARDLGLAFTVMEIRD